MFERKRGTEREGGGGELKLRKGQEGSRQWLNTGLTKKAA